MEIHVTDTAHQQLEHSKNQAIRIVAQDTYE